MSSLGREAAALHGITTQTLPAKVNCRLYASQLNMGSWHVMQPNRRLLWIEQRLISSCSGWLSALMTSTFAVTGALKMETTLSSDVPGLKSR